MTTGSENVARLAVLIDTDNANPATIEALLAEVAKFGTAHVKRACGGWTGTRLKGWKDQLLAQSFQQFAYTGARTPRTRRWSSMRWTCMALPCEPVGEECLRRRGERGHGRSSHASSRLPAAAMSSGEAVRYQ